MKKILLLNSKTMLFAFALALLSFSQKNYAQNCNLLQSFVNNTNFDNIEVAVLDTPFSVIPPCLGSVSNTNNILGDINSHATVSMTGLACDTSITVRDTDDDYAAGTYAGFELGGAGLLSVDVIANIEITTFLNGNEQESEVVLNELIGADTFLLSSNNRTILGFVTSLDFDEVRIEFQSLLDVLYYVEIYRAVIQEFCPGPSLACNAITSITGPEHPVLINTLKTGVSSLACVGCEVIDAGDVIDTDENNYAKLILPISVGTQVSLSVENRLAEYTEGTYAGFELENESLIDVDLIDAITICTYLNGVEQECKTGDAQLLIVGSEFLFGLNRNTIGFVSNTSFDEVQISITNLVGVDLGITRVFNLVAQKFCAADLQCDTSYAMTNPSLPVVLDDGLTGISGLACVLCDVEDTTNVINEALDDFAVISMAAGVLASGSVGVTDAVATYPAGTTTGFAVSSTINLLNVELFETLTVCTYLDGVQQECKSGMDILDVTVLLNIGGITSTPVFAGFETTQPYNAVQISVGSLASVINIVNVYAAFLDTTGAISGEDYGISCCVAGSVAPTLAASSNVENTCPINTVDLDSLHTGTNPTGTTLVWSIDSNGIDLSSTEASPEAIASSGVYYAYYYDATNNCYSPVSAAVNVTIDSCLYVCTMLSHCPDEGDNDVDNDGIPNRCDLDDDNDGISDIDESGGIDPDGDMNGDCTPNWQNGSGSRNINSYFDNDRDGIPNHHDLDSDNDGIYDVVEAGGTDLNNDGRADDDDNNVDNTNSYGIPTSAGSGINPISTTEGTLDMFNLDSDGDGCSDSNEAYGKASADGGSGQFGYGSDPVVVNPDGTVRSAYYSTGSTQVPAVVIADEDLDNDGLVGACDVDGHKERPLSTNDFSKIQFHVFPNPATAFITISGVETIDKIEIYSIRGSRVLVTQSKTIPVANFTAGMYFVKIQSNDNYETHKIILK